MTLEELQAQGAQPANQTSKQSYTLEELQAMKATSAAPPPEKQGSIVGNVVKNLIPSAVNFAKGIVQAPIQGAKDIAQIPAAFRELKQQTGSTGAVIKAAAKEFPSQLYQGAVPEATKDVIAGNYGAASQKIQEDPVGQILPYLMLGRAAAGKAGVGEQFDKAIETISKPVTKPASTLVSKTAKGIGNMTTGAIGISTGKSPASFKEAYQSGKNISLGGLTGFSEGTAFSEQMRNKAPSSSIARAAEDAVSKIVEERGNNYRTSLENIKNISKSIDISPIGEELGKQLKNFGLVDEQGNLKLNEKGDLDFSRSVIGDRTGQADIQEVVNLMKDWGTKSGDRTPAGLDVLKRRLGDLYSPSANTRAFVTAMKNSVKKTITDQVPEYEKMTKAYETASDLLSDIKSATSIGGRAGEETIIKKLTASMKGNNEFRKAIVEKLQEAGGQDIKGKIAGAELKQFEASGLLGRGLELGAGALIVRGIFSGGLGFAKEIAALIATSPRLMGEFFQALGFSAKATSKIFNAVNNIPKKVTTPIKLNKK